MKGTQQSLGTPSTCQQASILSQLDHEDTKQLSTDWKYFQAADILVFNSHDDSVDPNLAGRAISHSRSN